MASFLEDVNSIKLLQSLLQPNDDSSDSEDDLLLPNNVHKFGPGDIASVPTGKPYTNKTSQSNESDILCQNSTVNKMAQSIEEFEELQDFEALNALESRKQPEYSISYKQCVTPQDVYLQMGNKSSATSSCEEMNIKILLPDETVGIDRMDLSVSSNEIDLQTPVYRLKLPLVQPINPDKGKAQFDSDQKFLLLSLKMEREFDFVNF